ncbi:hypothetical protein HOD65_03285, partial [bacterium]|nr:hypothetical protein [bacterium]
LSNILNKSKRLEIIVGDREVGYLGEIDDKYLNKNDIKVSVSYWQINYSEIIKYVTDKKKYKSLPKYPGMTYDLSLSVSDDVSWADIKHEVESSSKLIQDVKLFDVYQVSKLGGDKKSLAFHIHFLDEKKTLETSEVEKIRKDIVNKLIKKFKVEIR